MEHAPDRTSHCYELRLESIGGLGAHLAGQMLAEAGVLGMGLSGAHFSSYGSEKKGTPLKSYVRLGPPEQKVRTTSPVRRPDLVAVFHEALLADPGVTSGLEPGGTLVVNSDKDPAQIAARLHLPGVRILTVDAGGIALQEQTRVNTAMVGAVAHSVPLLEPAAIRSVIAATFGKKYPALVDANLRTFDRGYTELREYTAPVDGDVHTIVTATGPVIGYRTAPIGGLLTTPGNSIAKHLGASRQGYLPVLNRDRCADCFVCDLVCPDYCLVWQPTGKIVNGYPAYALQGIDYQYCKGCMHCVQECPTGALSKEREVGDVAERLSVKLVPGPVLQIREGR